MIKEAKKFWGAAKVITGLSDTGLCGVETLTDCNRAGQCLYCNVTGRWDMAKASTLREGCQQIQWTHDEGGNVLNLGGGETLARGRFITKERIPFVKHNTELTRYAHDLGMVTNITTNGDFIVSPDYDILPDLKKAGLDTLTYTLHRTDDVTTEKILDKAKATARLGIIPIISVVFTADKTERIPELARICAVNGIPFGTTIVQELGKGYSAVPQESQIPSVEQVKEVFMALAPLKLAGFVTNSWKYLTQAPNYPNNSWKCNPGKDSFVHIRSQEEKGEIGVCSEVRTGFRTGEIELKSEGWRNRKLDLVENCKGCLYRCTFEAENPDFPNNLPALAVMGLIKSGHYEIVQKWGKLAVALSPAIKPFTTGKAYLESIIDRALGKTAWRESMQHKSLKMLIYPDDDRSYKWRALSRVIEHAAPFYSCLEILFPLSSRFFTVERNYVKPSSVTLPALAVDMSILWLLISAQTDLPGYIGLKFLANVASHMAWDLGSSAVQKIRSFRSAAVSISA